MASSVNGPTIGTVYEEIIHYGNVTPCFDLHPNQIQPSHIVVTSPWFETREVRMSQKSHGRLREQKDKQERALRMSDEGASMREIGAALGIKTYAARRLVNRLRA